MGGGGGRGATGARAASRRGRARARLDPGVDDDADKDKEDRDVGLEEHRGRRQKDGEEHKADLAHHHERDLPVDVRRARLKAAKEEAVRVDKLAPREVVPVRKQDEEADERDACARTGDQQGWVSCELRCRVARYTRVPNE